MPTDNSSLSVASPQIQATAGIAASGSDRRLREIRQDYGRGLMGMLGEMLTQEIFSVVISIGGADDDMDMFAIGQLRIGSEVL
ncbi:MAG: hypothetical protein RL077_2940 [Verrucomicrobiota bacterium]